MKTHSLISMLVIALLGIVLTSCAPSVGVRADYGYGPRYGYSPYMYRRPPVIVTPPPRVIYRSHPHRQKHYRNYRRAPQQYSYRPYRGPR
ncbi:hypothetical protein ACFPMF_16595 [Larkinella bovis]|uniref:Lipoprotein n=1 Tax=Larkinella bovis TaxID=683041 RepID=A0ABW0IEW6_9BACT